VIDVVLVIAAVLSAAGVGLLGGMRVQKRAQLIERELADAQLAADALRGCTRVDGVDLPLPNAAWKPEYVKFENSKQLCLVLGMVNVIEKGALVYAGNGYPMPTTEATKAYAAAVWCAYRNRCARKSFEKACT